MHFALYSCDNPRAYNSNKVASDEVERVLCLAQEETGRSGDTPSKELVTKGKGKYGRTSK